MKTPLLHSDFTLDGISFDTISAYFDFIDSHYPKAGELVRQWFGQGRIEVKTSGSTGKPKRILFTREQMIASARATGEFFGMGSGSRALLCLPLEFIAGKMMLIRAMTLGWHLEGVEPGIRLDVAEDKNYDFAAMIPLQLENNLDYLEKIENLIVGGAPVHWSLQEKVERASSQIYATYGMTETITHVAVKALNERARTRQVLNDKSFPEKAFRSLPGVTFSQDDRGCLVIECPRISQEGIITNDIVDLLSDQSFVLLGRIDNVINSAGLKLLPELIEAKFSKCLESRFFAAGLADPELGELLVFVVESDPDPEIIDRLKKCQLESGGHISKHELPKKILYLPDLIETKSGKIQRNESLDAALMR